MNTSSTIACPDWCITDAETHALDEPGNALHRSAPLGMFDFWKDNHGPITATVWPKVAELSPADLRQLAADALAAAEWIEAHR